MRVSRRQCPESQDKQTGSQTSQQNVAKCCTRCGL